MVRANIMGVPQDSPVNKEMLIKANIRGIPQDSWLHVPSRRIPDLENQEW